MPSPRGAKKVVITGDWDADGVISAAQLYYAQHYKGTFPIRSNNVIIQLIPAGPRSIAERVEKFECGDFLVILDIPYTENMKAALESYRTRCPGATILYFDHHDSTISSVAELESKYDVKLFIGRNPTSIIVMTTLKSLGINLLPRLQDFANAVMVLEGRGKAGRLPEKVKVNKRIVEMAAAISKLLNRNKNDEIWIKFVKWLSNPLPFEDADITAALKEAEWSRSSSLIEEARRVGEEADREVSRVATMMAMSAEDLGFIRFVDVRGKWDKPGASALASKIQRILGMPVAILVESSGERILIIRSGRGRGEARRILDILYEWGVVADKGGHEDIGTGRLNEEVTLAQLKEKLRRASFEAFKKRGSSWEGRATRV